MTATERRDLATPDGELSVLALIDHFALGGAELLLSHFAAVAPLAGIRLSVACLADLDGNPAAQPLREAGIEPVNLDVPGRTGVQAIGATRRHIASLQPDLVHTHLRGADFAGSVAARSLNVPVVSTIHAMRWDRTPGQRARQMFYDSCFRLCGTRFVAVSDSARRSLLAERHVVASRVTTIYNGVVATTAPGAGAAVRHELGLGPEHLVLGMVSALRPEKGHDRALDAFGLLRREFPHVRMVIAGQGKAEAAIARRAREYGDAVIMTGRRPDVMAVWDAIDLCVHPSHADALPTTLIEAMMAAVPVVATAVGGIPEVVTDGRTGVLVRATADPAALAAAIAGLLSDPDRRRALAAEGALAARARFEPLRWARETRAYYGSILADWAAMGRRPHWQRPESEPPPVLSAGRRL